MKTIQYLYIITIFLFVTGCSSANKNVSEIFGSGANATYSCCTTDARVSGPIGRLSFSLSTVMDDQVFTYADRFSSGPYVLVFTPDFMNGSMEPGDIDIDSPLGRQIRDAAKDEGANCGGGSLLNCGEINIYRLNYVPDNDTRYVESINTFFDSGNDNDYDYVYDHVGVYFVVFSNNDSTSSATTPQLGIRQG